MTATDSVLSRGRPKKKSGAMSGSATKIDYGASFDLGPGLKKAFPGISNSHISVFWGRVLLVLVGVVFALSLATWFMLKTPFFES